MPTDNPSEYAMRVARAWLDGSSLVRVTPAETPEQAIQRLDRDLARLIDRERAEAAAQEREAWTVECLEHCRWSTRKCDPEKEEVCTACDILTAMRARGEGER